jgi:ATP-binding cassette subfamily C (CFTR/MRP) protein 1
LLLLIQRWLTLVLDLVTTGLAVLVVSVIVALRNRISIGFTGVALTQIISFTGYLKLVIMFWTQLETSIAAVARIKQFSEETGNENLEDESLEPPPGWPTRGQIDIHGVSAAYG